MGDIVEYNKSLWIVTNKNFQWGLLLTKITKHGIGTIGYINEERVKKKVGRIPPRVIEEILNCSHIMLDGYK